MDYTSIQQAGNDIVLGGVNYFDLAQTLDCGQAFRWVFAGGGKFTGIAHGRRLELELFDSNLTLKDVTLQEFELTWKNYFDLGRSYGGLRDLFINYDTMTKALAFSPGLRLMRQDAWEILISFILSQNSNIPRIKKMIELLCQNFGKALPCGGFAFPTADNLAVLSINDLDVIRSGYRAAYIVDAARRVASGTLDLASISGQPTETVRRALLDVHGVGPKVADCVLLFGFGRAECFPLDVWMKRVTAKLYPNGFPEELRQYAGIAQQFLFHYARSHGDEF
ncbi:MAG: DNA-3-methyladenine glycosylase 2 family protein [Firmicutes bacterium]|nr:DNA-3-methyladenine glycosylase 2 family protein [Bacillota bacterium]